MVSSETVVFRADVLWRRTADTVVIRRRGNDELVVLAGTGADLWDSLAEPSSVGDVAAALAEEFGAELPVVRNDVERAVADLIERGVVGGC